MPAQEVHAGMIGGWLTAVGWVVGDAVLGDQDLRRGVVAAEPHEDVMKALRINLLPARCGDGMGLDRAPLAIDHDGRVVVDPKEVDGCGDSVKVPFSGCRFNTGSDAAIRTAEVWIAALEQWVEVEGVLRGISSQRGGFRLRAIVRGVAGGKLQAGPDPADAFDPTERRNCAAVSQVEVVNDHSRRTQVAFARRHPAVLVTLLGDDFCLVDGQPIANSVTQRLEEHPRVVGEPFGTISGLPPTVVLQGLRQVPVVEGGDRRDAPGEQPVDEPVIEVEAPAVDGLATFRKHAGPRDGEPVGADPEAPHQVKIRLPPVVMVAGHRARTAV
jgi:hypothetical protein